MTGPTYVHTQRSAAADHPTAYLDEDQIKAIERHIATYIGPFNGVFHEIVSDALHIDIICVEPTPDRPWYTFLTMGMSALPMHVPARMEGDWRFAELMICLPADWPVPDGAQGENFQDDGAYWPIGFMKMLARMPVEYETWLFEGHSIPNGHPAEPFAGNTKLNGVVLSVPMEETEFCTLNLPGDRQVHFWQIIPVYDEEMNYKLEHGFDALVQKFSRHRISPVVDLNRVNTCQRKKLFGLF